MPSTAAQRRALGNHRTAARFLRRIPAVAGNAPLIKYAALKLGPDKGNSMHLNRLFNGTPAKLAAKLAGLPKPTNCL